MAVIEINEEALQFAFENQAYISKEKVEAIIGDYLARVADLEADKPKE